MCVPESGLRYYESQLDLEHEAMMNGFDSAEEYQEFKTDKAENDAYDNFKENERM